MSHFFSASTNYLNKTRKLKTTSNSGGYDFKKINKVLKTFNTGLSQTIDQKEAPTSESEKITKIAAKATLSVTSIIERMTETRAIVTEQEEKTTPDISSQPSAALQQLEMREMLPNDKKHDLMQQTMSHREEMKKKYYKIVGNGTICQRLLPTAQQAPLPPGMLTVSNASENIDTNPGCLAGFIKLFRC